jgi:hypothetical protein
MIAVGYTCLLLMAGCYLGDAVARGAVAVTLPASRDGTPRSVTDTDVQEALRLIDGVLASNGHPRDQNPLPAEDQARGLVASYGICGVTLEHLTLVVGCIEPHQSHLSAQLAKTMEQLKAILTGRYGRQSVRIED